MIVDSIRNWKSYTGILPNYERAMEFALSIQDAPAGRYDCDDLPEGAVYAMIQEGETQPPEDGLLEAHRKYADVQMMLDGGEAVYYSDIEGLAEAVPYKDDAAFYKNACQPIHISKGMFYVALPQDGHMPCRNMNDQQVRFRKIVLKIRL